MDKNKFLEQLLKERNHHFDHPYQVSLRFWYGVAIFIVAGLAIVFTHKHVLDPTKLHCKFWLTLVPIVGGWVIASLGIMLHGYAHKKQRGKIEEAIHDLIFEKKEPADLKGKYGAFNLDVYTNILKDQPLFSAEPFQRGFVIPDILLIAGIVISFISTIIFLINLNSYTV